MFFYFDKKITIIDIRRKIMKKAVEGITINMQSLNWTFGHPQGSLVGNYGQFDKKKLLHSPKIDPRTVE